MRTSIFLLAVTTLTLAWSGCHPHHSGCEDGYCADIRFDWQFELYDGEITTSCQVADVEEVIITIYWDNVIEYEKVRPCSDHGATITNFFYPDTYYLILEAYDSYGELTPHIFEDYIELEYDGLNDFGYLTLDYVD